MCGADDPSRSLINQSVVEIANKFRIEGEEGPTLIVERRTYCTDARIEYFLPIRKVTSEESTCGFRRKEKAFLTQSSELIESMPFKSSLTVQNAHVARYS